MAVYKIFPEKDATLYSSYPSKNTGLDQIIEASTYQQNGLGQASRYLIKFEQDEIEDVIFLSLTNKITDLPENVISGGVNSLSQINAIKKFLELNEIKKTIFLTPNLNYKN